MKKIIIPILIILLLGGTVAGVLLLNRKHKEDVKKYKETVKDLMSLLYNDADDLEQGIRDTLAEWKKAAEEAGSSDVSKGFLEDVLSREEQKEIRNQLLTQFKAHRNDRLNLKEKIEDFRRVRRRLTTMFWHTGSFFIRWATPIRTSPRWMPPMIVAASCWRPRARK